MRKPEENMVGYTSFSVREHSGKSTSGKEVARGNFHWCFRVGKGPHLPL